MTYSRANTEILLFMVRNALQALHVLSELLTQMSGYLEHLRHGGDANEWRRDRWITTEQVKARYKAQSPK